MSHFVDIPPLSIVAHGWLLDGDLIYDSDILGRNIVVPRGTFTDLASVPWFARWLVPVSTGRNRLAAIVHDYLCRPEGKIRYNVSQKTADKVFREALLVCGVKPWQAQALYVPVRAFQSVSGLFRRG